MTTESKKRVFGLNARNTGNYALDSRGRITPQPLEEMEAAMASEELDDKLRLIRAGRDDLKDTLGDWTPHYRQFLGDHRSQQDILPEAFTYRTVVDIDDPSMGEQAVSQAMMLNGMPGSRWRGAVERITGSVHYRPEQGIYKVHIELMLPPGMTVSETQEAFCRDLGVTCDASCQTPERFIYITSKRDEIYRSPSWNRELTDEELRVRREAFEARGLDIDGRPRKGQGSAAANQTPVTQAVQPQGTPRAVEPSAAVAVVRMAMLKAGITEGQLLREGGRHEALLRLLSTGICRKLDRASLTAALTAITPYTDEPDARQLVDDFAEGGRYYESVPCQLDPITSQPTGLSGGSALSEPRHDYQTEGELLWQKALPKCFRLAMRLTPAKAWNALVLAMASAFGSQMGHLPAKDPLDWEQPPRLLVVIIAARGGGKASIRRIVDAICGPMYARDEKARVAYEAWKLQRKLKGANKAMQAPPTAWIQEMPLDTSNARRLEMAKNTPADGICFTFDEEGGYTLSAMESQGSWNDCSKFMNNAWDGSVYTVERAGQDSVSGRERASLNLCIFSQVQLARQAFGRHIAQGLTSRLALGYIEQEAYQQLERMKPLSDADAQTLGDMAERLRTMPAQELRLPAVARRLKQWEEERVGQAAAAGDQIVGDPGVRGRAMTNAFRICQVIWAVHLAEGNFKAVPKSLEETGVFIADMLVDNFRLFFGDLYLRQQQGSPVALQDARQPQKGSDLLAQLPREFTRDDLKRLHPKAKANALSMLLRRWTDSRKVEKTGNGYRKT